jgi:hypothetical protein
MKNDDIKTSTAVSHPDGGGYVIQRMSMNGAGEILTVAIGKDLHATAVFDGHPSEARKHGFLFGDEGRPGGLPHGTIVTHSAYPDRTYGYQPDGTSSGGMAVYRIMRDGVAVTAGTVDSLSESGFQFNSPDQPTCDVCGAHEAEQEWCGNCGCCLIHCQKHDGCPNTGVTVEEIEALLEPVEPSASDMRLIIDSLNAQVQALQHELTACKERVAEGVAKRDAVYGELSEFKERVRNEVESAKVTHDLCIDGCNSFLEELGLPLLTRKWKGTVTRDSDGELLLTVTGIEADNEDDAKEELESNFSVKATVKAVTFDYEYDGGGDADWEYSDTEDTDFDEEDDDYADGHKDALTFSVEEE